MRTLYIEPFSGMAGDMFLAALIDLGDPRFTLDDLKQLAEALVPGESRIELETVWRGNLSGRLLSVRTGETHAAPHRTYSDLAQLIACAGLSKAVERRSCDVLARIAAAEAQVHGTTPDQIHFHEIGAVDTLIDVCGSVLAIERLSVARIVSTTPVTGTGTVRCAHGEMPVPTPAVSELLRGKPISISGGGGERLTPTGAALLAELVDTFDELGDFVCERIGYGAGARDPQTGPPNILRVQLGHAACEAQARTRVEELEVHLADRSTAARTLVWQVEVNLDDMTGEELAHAAARLRELGVLDVWTTPVVMKKDRPGVVVSALCRTNQRIVVEQVLLEQTTTFGLRWRPCERLECERRTLEVALSGERVRVKQRLRPSPAGSQSISERDLSPEHDDVARVASLFGWSLREVERRAIALALESLAGSSQERSQS